MNRETKRMMQRQGQMEADGSPTRRAPATSTPRNSGNKTKLSIPARIGEFIREIRSELKQVAWPTRPEVINSSMVVFITLIFLVGLIFGLNWCFSHSESFLVK